MTGEPEELKCRPDRYLDYLNKGLSIMGVLSTFCLAVPSLICERVISAAPTPLGYKFSKDPSPKISFGG
jgi:hypothetical protein